MLKAYQYRIYPNNERKVQKVQIAKTFGCCRFVYNKTLAYQKETYEKEKKSVSKTDCNNYCTRELKKEYEWLKEVDKLHREFSGQIKYATISQVPSEKYFVSILVETDYEEIPHTNRNIGLDLGIRDLCIPQMEQNMKIRKQYKNMKKNSQNCKDNYHIKKKRIIIIIKRENKLHYVMRKLQIPEKII